MEQPAGAAPAAGTALAPAGHAAADRALLAVPGWPARAEYDEDGYFQCET